MEENNFRNPFSRPVIFAVAPVILVMFFDLFFTLFGQPDYYWQNPSYFNEGSPLGKFLMLNPFHFILFFFFYILLVIALTSFAPRPLNLIFGISFYLGHVWGSSTWLTVIFRKLTGVSLLWNDWYLYIGYFVFIAAISAFSLSKWWEGLKIPDEKKFNLPKNVPSKS